MNHLQGFGLLFLGGGLLAVWGGAGQLRRKRDQVRRAVAVTARVTGVESDGGDSEELVRYYPVVAFEAGGKPVRARLLRGTPRRDEYRAGAELRVYYDPGDPTQAVARRHDFPGQGAAVVIGAALAVLGAALVWAGWGGGRAD